VNPEIEETVLQAFIVPGKREQYVSRFALAKARQKFMNSHLFHMRALTHASPSGLTRSIKRLRGSTSCFVSAARQKVAT